MGINKFRHSYSDCKISVDITVQMHFSTYDFINSAHDVRAQQPVLSELSDYDYLFLWFSRSFNERIMRK